MAELIGHGRIMALFDTLIERGAINHAYCFIGQNSVGKRTAAVLVAARLLGVIPEKIHTSPDYHCVERATDENTGKLKKDISIEQIRSLVSSLRQSAFKSGGYRVAIIDGAEYLNAPAGNALLKILEEPGGKTVLILTVRDESQLLPTVLSRMQRIYFALVPAAELAEYAERRGLKKAEAALLAEAARGRPGWMLDALAVPEGEKQKPLEQERFLSLFGRPWYEKLEAVDGLFGDKTDHIAAREELISVLDEWHVSLARIVREPLADKAGTAIGSRAKLTPHGIIALDYALRQAKEELARNVHPRLLVERVLLAIP
ncbi:MAG: DNA-directed DNA polymerase, delta prime subunit [Candidatus Magasanikbacteria bacterium GW2011_GWA2_56_11]|uniref:DNA-directed DNA polymerase, delta prime subunit n=1 Tax=Candidatus Magasanikbacteria bacterium GW2011_GWA2_56_11 TaxID=1619044 RepID=A0A0G2ANV2_9BACT|nr:MAG: DNA-directed DNA polymerase, delta prime subunit [Candidatus Magasanikbacteria bacterium GW2011_GWA2_56_11]